MSNITLENIISNPMIVWGTVAAISSVAGYHCWNSPSISGPRKGDTVTVALTDKIVKELGLNEKQKEIIETEKNALLGNLHKERKFQWAIMGALIGASITGIAFGILQLSSYCAAYAAAARAARLEEGLLWIGK